MRKVWAEMFGTFVLVFAGTGAIVANDVSGGAVTHVGVSLTFGLAVMAMIYAVGDVSGAHLNPAVTLGFWLSGRLPSRWMPAYLASQFAGAFAASGMLRGLFPSHAMLGATLPSGGAAQSFVLEAVLTGVLMYVILSVATGPKETGILAGIAIGGVITFEALLGGPISGASMNPARSLSPAVVSGTFRHLWIYLTAPVLGAAAATAAFAWVRPRDVPCLPKFEAPGA